MEASILQEKNIFVNIIGLTNLHLCPIIHDVVTPNLAFLPRRDIATCSLTDVSFQKLENMVQTNSC